MYLRSLLEALGEEADFTMGLLGWWGGRVISRACAASLEEDGTLLLSTVGFVLTIELDFSVGELSLLSALGLLGSELVLLLLTGFVFATVLTAWSEAAVGNSFLGEISLGLAVATACSLISCFVTVSGTNLCSEDSSMVFIGTREYTHFLNMYVSKMQIREAVG